MKAYVAQTPGKTEIVLDHSVGKPAAKQIRVKVVACGLNFADLLMIDGKYQDTPSFPFVPGMEICGEIVELGSSVTGIALGDRISAFSGSGGLCEEIIIDTSRCLPVPDAVSDIEAAGFQIAYGTSHLALTRRARLAAGETLVVLGAAGGVGLTAVEIGKAMGARVIAVARGVQKRQICKDAGADVTIDAETKDLRAELLELGGVDVVYDAVGGTLGEAAMRALRPEGRYLVIGFASGNVPGVKLNHMLVKNIEAIGFYWGGYLKANPDVMMASLNDLLEWRVAGRIHPHISHTLPFDQVEQGLDLLRNRKATGKVVITL